MRLLPAYSPLHFTPTHSHLTSLFGCPACMQKYWDMRNGRPWHYVSPLMIEAAYKGSQHWAGVAGELAQPFDRTAADPHALATDK